MLEIVVDHFGYLHYEEAVFVNYGANTFDIALVSAPSGVLTGTVLEADIVILYEYNHETGDMAVPPVIWGELWQPEQ